MMTRKDVDYVVGGAGLTGVVIARKLHEAGKSVCIVEQRPHIGGNVYDTLHSSGIRIHAYGPHYFRTNSKEIWDFVNEFGEFYPYEAVIKSYSMGKMFRWPLNKSELTAFFGEFSPSVQRQAENFEEVMLNQIPLSIYNVFIAPYTEKQWGKSPKVLAADLAGRIELRMNDDPRLKISRYQGIPRGGYTRWFDKMLEPIDVELNVDYLSHKKDYAWRKKLIYTGPIERYFDSCFGKLAYRAQKRSHLFLPETRQALPCGQINYPQWEDGALIRTIEWKHMLEVGEYEGPGTLLTTETPYSPEGWLDLEYPCPENDSRQRFAQYRALAKDDSRLLICGRLGEYRYLDMDQAISRALYLVKKILDNEND